MKTDEIIDKIVAERYESKDPAVLLLLRGMVAEIVARAFALRDAPVASPGPLMRKTEPRDGDLMTKQDFVDACRSGALIDYDGFGDLATETHHCSDFRVYPSQCRLSGGWPKWATHVLWYNR